MVEETGFEKPLNDRDLPLDEDLEGDAGAEMVCCPHCKEMIHEETVKCPYCEEWIIDRPVYETKRSKWFWPIVVAIGAVMILVTLVSRALR